MNGHILLILRNILVNEIDPKINGNHKILMLLQFKLSLESSVYSCPW